ncbi:MAG: glycosyltransferase family 9 protein [Lewinellaceae bacterium]|nr:glycosyltransferase family 9 protein [Lewinellaceae bacterium]
MKILVLRFSSIGDIVLTTPVMRCLKRQSGATVHVLTKARFAETLDGNPHVDRLWLFDKSVQEVLPALRQEQYDWVIDLHNNIRSWRLIWSLRRPFRRFNKLNLQKWMLVQLGINVLPDLHIVDRYLATVRHLGVENDGLGLDFFVSDRADADILPLIPQTPFLAFALGANHNTKRLTYEQILVVCQQSKIPVVLLGGPAEAQMGIDIAAQCGEKVWNACGKLNLQGSAAVMGKAAVVLTHDTGLMHIAAALRKPIVSVWGNTVPEFGMYPFFPKGEGRGVMVQTEGLPCRPCSKIGFSECPKGHFQCIRSIPSSTILQAIDQLKHAPEQAN